MYHVSCFIPLRQATPDGHISKHPMGISQEILSMNTLHKVPTSIVFKISRQLYPGILHLFHIQDLTLNLPKWSDEYYHLRETNFYRYPHHPYLCHYHTPAYNTYLLFHSHSLLEDPRYWIRKPSPIKTRMTATRIYWKWKRGQREGRNQNNRGNGGEGQNREKRDGKETKGTTLKTI